LSSFELNKKHVLPKLGFSGNNLKNLNDKLYRNIQYKILLCFYGQSPEAKTAVNNSGGVGGHKFKCKDQQSLLHITGTCGELYVGQSKKI